MSAYTETVHVYVYHACISK